MTEETSVNKAFAALKQIMQYAKENGIELSHILVPRTTLNDVRLGMMSLGLRPIDYYDPKVEGRNLRFDDMLLIEDLTIDEIHAVVNRG